MRKLCQFYYQLLHPKEMIAEKADEHFFFFTSFLILKFQFRADPPKDCGTYFLVPITWYFSKNIFLLYGRFQGAQSIFRKLFILFTEILHLTEIASAPVS
jgi:hypothetical protein